MFGCLLLSDRWVRVLSTFLEDILLSFGKLIRTSDVELLKTATRERTDLQIGAAGSAVKEGGGGVEETDNCFYQRACALKVKEAKASVRNIHLTACAPINSER